MTGPPSTRKAVAPARWSPVDWRSADVIAQSPEKPEIGLLLKMDRNSRSSDGALRPGRETCAAASCNIDSRILSRSLATNPSSINAGSRTACSPSFSMI
jgi:hypothetical protein